MTVGDYMKDGFCHRLLDRTIRRTMLTADKRDLLQLLACGDALAGEANCLFDRPITEKRKQA